MPSDFLKVYRIKSTNVYPYDDVQSVKLVDRAAPALLVADLRAETTYRCYRRHPGQFLTLAAMEPYDESWEGDSGPEVSPYQLLAERPLAYQVEYVLFQSWRAADYEKLESLVQRVKSGVLDTSGLPDALRPGRCQTEADEESDPWQSLRLNGTRPPDHPTSTFLVTERSKFPYINNHTIPEGIDYGFVQASVVNYDFYPTPPRYGELMDRLDTYCDWFESVK